MKKQTGKDFFKLMNSVAFEKNYGKFEKTKKYQRCNNIKEGKLFSIRTKLSCYKFFQIKFISNRNGKKSNSYVQACLCSFIYIRSE